jgi:putative inorganic carbon (HCO3(-)) transporter
MKGLLFTYLLTYGGATASLFNPFLGLLIYVCFAIVKPESMWYWSVPEGNYSRIVAVGLLLGWIGSGFGSWQFGRARGIVYCLIGYWLWSVVAIAFGTDNERSMRFVESQAKIVLPFLVGITTIDSLQRVKLLAWVMVLSEGYVALEFNLAYYSGYNRLWEEGFGLMDNNCNAIALVTCVGLALFLFLHAERWWAKSVAAAALLLIAHAIFFSFSRGGMLALTVTLFVSFLLIPKDPKHYLLFALAVVILLRLAGPEVTQRFETTFAHAEHRDQSSQSRLVLWEACWQCMLQHPQGVGPDHWPLIVEQYNFPRGKEGHTLWLQIGAELGFPGLLLLLSFYCLCLVRLWPLTSDRSSVADPWCFHLARMVFAALIGFMLAAQFVSLKGLEHPFYIVLIGATVLKLQHLPLHNVYESEAAGALTGTHAGY